MKKMVMMVMVILGLNVAAIADLIVPISGSVVVKSKLFYSPDHKKILANVHVLRNPELIILYFNADKREWSIDQEMKHWAKLGKIEQLEKITGERFPDRIRKQVVWFNSEAKFAVGIVSDIRTINALKRYGIHDISKSRVYAVQVYDFNKMTMSTAAIIWDKEMLGEFPKGVPIRR